MSDLGSALRTRLGTAAAHEMTVALDEAKVDTLRAAQEQFDARMDARFAQARSEFRGDLATVDANLRVAMSEGFSTIRSGCAESRRNSMPTIVLDGRTPKAVESTDLDLGTGAG